MEKSEKTKFKHKKKIIFGLLGVLLILGGPIAAAIIAARIPYYTFIGSARDFNRINNRLDGYYLTTSQTWFSDGGIIPVGTKEKPFTGIFEATSTNRTMRSLCNISFDSNYIEEQFSNDSIDEVNIGLFAYNAGTIKGFFLYEIAIPDLSTHLDSEKTINFGPVACHNSGTIERCSSQALRGTLVGNHIVAGGIAAINSGKISYCSPDTNFNVETYGESYVGGIAGISKKELEKNHIDPYIFDCSCAVPKTIVHKKEDYDFYIGGICGFSDGGEISSCKISFTPSITSRDSFTKKVYFGSIVGYLTGNLNINHIFAFNSFSSSILEGYYASGVGFIKSNSSLAAKSLILHSSLNLSSSTSYCGYLYGFKENDVNIISDGTTLYYDSSISGSNINKDFSNETTFENINLSNLSFDTSKWSKNDNKKVLELHLDL